MPPSSGHQEVAGEVPCQVDLRLLFLDAYELVAQKLPAEDLPSLRLVSKQWYHAANKAVLLFGKPGFFSKSQLAHLHLAAQRFPGLSTLDLTFLPLHNTSPYLKTLMPLTSLQNISMYYLAAQKADGWALLQQQKCLTSFRSVSLDFIGGFEDPLLLKVASLCTLVSLDMSLSSRVTDTGLRSLSCLTNLMSLELPVSKVYEAFFSAKSLSVFTALTRLTFLSLRGWPINDVDVNTLTCLTSLQHLGLSECERLTCLCFMPLLQFPNLNTVEIVRGDDWMIDAIVTMFEFLRPSIKLVL
ncbi:hypothetical protein ABBQ38_008367 [Trebouxia sp. C0009 RCD-2024]